MRLLAIGCILLAHVNFISGQCKVLVCSMGETESLYPQMIDPFLCTHLMYHNFDFTMRTVLPNNSLTEKNLLTKQYIQETINFLRRHAFDGVVLYHTVSEANRSLSDKSKFVLLLQDFYARHVLSKGAAKTKLIVSLTTRSRYFIYVNLMYLKCKYIMNGPKDFLSVCIALKKMVKKYDNVGKVPYAESKDDAVMYEDQDSLKLKVNYVKKNGLAGVCVLSLDTDDFIGLCFNRIFPLTNAVKDECR
ncbi:Chitinase-3-like protein 1 [Bulinus truncatus]|nr:Chitinase-3-like protein 1 [Bulinus truncatus]